MASKALWSREASRETDASVQGSWHIEPTADLPRDQRGLDPAVSKTSLPSGHESVFFSFLGMQARMDGPSNAETHLTLCHRAWGKTQACAGLYRRTSIGIMF